MKLIRPSSANKENADRSADQDQKARTEQMKRDLKNAFAQIHMLKINNQ